MLSAGGFDLWADGYDRSVGLSDEDGTYPCAGYRRVLNGVYGRVLASGAEKVLDIGFGTGVLTAKLYERGIEIFGQDFSPRMIALAQEKMPRARLYQGDFAKGLVPPLLAERYDAVIATYSLHHLTDGQKTALLNTLLPLLRKGGCICIGDVAFATRAALTACAAATADWDNEEYYFAADEMRAAFPQLEFEQMSFCAGLIMLKD